MLLFHLVHGLCGVKMNGKILNIVLRDGKDYKKDQRMVIIQYQQQYFQQIHHKKIEEEEIQDLIDQMIQINLNQDPDQENPLHLDDEIPPIAKEPHQNPLLIDPLIMLIQKHQ